MKFENLKEILKEFQQKYRETTPLKVTDIKRILADYPNEYVPVIFPSSWINGLGILRGLGREGLKSIVMDHKVDALCFYSKYAIPYQLPCDPIMESGKKEQTLESLMTIGNMIQQMGKSAVLMLTDSENLLDFVIRNFDDLSSLFVFSADYRKQKKLEDKKVQLSIADECGVSIPNSYFVSSQDEFNKISPQMKYPLIIKPRGGKEFYREFGHQAIKVSTQEDCEKIYKKVKSFDLIFQEEIPGPDENLYTLGSYCDRNSEPKAIFVGKKLKNNRGFGTCEMGISCEDPEVAKLGLRILKHVGYWGASQVEFKKDTRDGKYKLIEINNRLWKWHSLAIDSNVNIPYIQYLDAIGMSLKNVPIQENGILWWLSLHDIATTIKEKNLSGLDLIKYLGDIDLDFVDAIGSIDDPLPFLVNFFEFMRV